MSSDYEYPLAQCDVAPAKHGTLRSYRDKRRLWLSWTEDDEHHAIWSVLSSMVWTDAVFKLLSKCAVDDESNPLNNTLLGQALIDGQIATQVLGIRRLTDDRNSDVISLRRLVKDIRRNFELFTRENYVCFDGLPYDYETALHKEMLAYAGKGAFWAATTGPTAHFTSRMAHEQFDRLAGIDPARRSREDRLPRSLIETVERWLDESGADELARWSHAYLAHAGGPAARERIADLVVTGNKITDAIRALARVTEALSVWMLCACGRSHGLMPVAQFDPFERLDRPIIYGSRADEAHSLWDRLGEERNRYLDDVEDELIGSAEP